MTIDRKLTYGKLRKLTRQTVLFFLITYCLNAKAQGIAEILGDKTHDYGQIKEANNLKSNFILKNTGSTPLYLLRADAGPQLRIRSCKRKIMPEDTTLLEVIFYPSGNGRFQENIKLVVSSDTVPLVLKIKGEVLNLKTNDKTACYTFGKPLVRRNNYSGPVFMSKQYLIPDSAVSTNNTSQKETDSIIVTVTPKVDTEIYRGELQPELYKANNVIFLIDVSGSMIDSVKLRWLKLSLCHLIQSAREMDRMSIITYRDSVRCLAENYHASDSAQLIAMINGLKAKGITRGNKAIHFALDLAVKHYLPEGSNQVILATDGKFPFSDDDYRIWNEKTVGRQILLSVLAFGNDKKAIETLKDISKKGNGSFVKVKTREEARTAIIDEIKLRSKR